MSHIDLTRVHDHPVNLLLKTDVHVDAAFFLSKFEASHDRTFAALDNDTLNALYEAYESNDAAEVMSIVADLLGL